MSDPHALTPAELQVFAQLNETARWLVTQWQRSPWWAVARREGLRLVSAQGTPGNPHARWAFRGKKVQPVGSHFWVNFNDTNGARIDGWEIEAWRAA